MGDNWNFQEVREVTGTLQEATGDQWKFTGNYGRWQENSNKKRSPLPSLRCAFVDIGRVMFVCSWVNVSELSRKFHSFSNILSRFLHLRTFLPPIGYLDQNQVKSLIPVANCWYLSPIADMMSTCVDLCRHMSIYVKKCRFLWIESILLDICRYMTKNVDFCAILVDMCWYTLIFVDSCRFMSSFVNLCRGSWWGGPKKVIFLKDHIERYYSFSSESLFKTVVSCGWKYSS